MAASLAAYQAIKTDVTTVTADQAALATATATETSDQTAFAASLTGVVVAVNGDGTADIITPTPGTPPGYSIVSATVLA